ncbi:MAG: hypothetical protein IT236_17930 [Bacteroidia bacterium]|nr:hypothetical protein [Bacteroidia bacterium]
MIMQNALRELECTYNRYEPVWQQWCSYEYNPLSEQDMNVVDIHQKNDFKLKHNLLKYYYNYKAITRATAALNKHYTEFKEWAVNRFYFNIARITTRPELGFVTTLEFRLIEMPDEIKAAIQKFSCRTVQELHLKYTDTDLMLEPNFKKVLQFLAACYVHMPYDYHMN